MHNFQSSWTTSLPSEFIRSMFKPKIIEKSTWLMINSGSLTRPSAYPLRPIEAPTTDHSTLPNIDESDQFPRFFPYLSFYRYLAGTFPMWTTHCRPKLQSNSYVIILYFVSDLFVFHSGPFLSNTTTKVSIVQFKCNCRPKIASQGLTSPYTFPENVYNKKHKKK